MAITQQIKTLNELLKQHGQETSISAKKVVWKMKGLDRRLGNYEGTPSQIQSLIRVLKNNPITDLQNLANQYQTQFNFQLPSGEVVKAGYDPGHAATINVSDWLTGAMAVGVDPNFATAIKSYAKGQLGNTIPTYNPATAVTPSSTAQATVQNAPPANIAQQQANVLAATGYTQEQLNAASATRVGVPEAKPIQVAPQTNFSSAQQTLETAKQTALNIQSQLQTLANKGYGKTDISQIPQNIDIANLPQKAGTTPTTPTITTPTATSALASAIPQAPTADEVYKQITGSEAYKLEQEKLGLKTTVDQATAEAKKAELESTYEADKNKLEQNLAAKGLAFSGIRAQDVQNLTDSLAASKLGVDRKLAASLLGADIDLREYTLKAVESTITEASKGRTEAIAQLNKLGYAVLGDQVLEIPKEDEIRSVSGVGVVKITPDGYQVLVPEQASEKTVPFSEWASSLGIVGLPISLGSQIAQQEAQNEKASEKEREIASVRANIYAWLTDKQNTTREQLLDQLVAVHKGLTRDEISTEVYGLTKSEDIKEGNKFINWIKSL